MRDALPVGRDLYGFPFKFYKPDISTNLDHIKPSNKLTGYSVALWHMPCSSFNRVDLVPCTSRRK